MITRRDSGFLHPEGVGESPLGRLPEATPAEERGEAFEQQHY